MNENQGLRDELAHLWDRLGYAGAASVNLYPKYSLSWHEAPVTSLINKAMQCIDEAINILEKEAGKER